MTRDHAGRSRAVRLVEGSSAGGPRARAVAQRAPAILLDRVRKLIATEALLYADVDGDPLTQPSTAPAAGGAAGGAPPGDPPPDPLDRLAKTLRRHGGRTLERHPTHLVACFEDVRDAFTTAIEAAQPRLRLSVHAYAPSDAELGPPAADLAEVASVGRAGHGGQILISAGAQQAVGDMVPRGATLGEAGRWITRGHDQPRPVFGLAHPRLETGFPPFAPARRQRHQLPRHVTAPLGRDDELVSLSHLLQPGRLVTLVGGAGVGKSRLAVEAASRSSDAFPGGVRFCDAAGAAEVGDVLGHLTSDLRREVTEPLDERVLLVLDGCDDLGPEVRGLIAGVHRPGGLGTVLATSSAPLGVPDEVVVPVSPLGTGSATRLLARLARGEDLALDGLDEHDPHLEEIAGLAGGVPLALELAAPLVGQLGPSDVVGRLTAAIAAHPPAVADDATSGSGSGSGSDDGVVDVVFADAPGGVLDAALDVSLAVLDADHVHLLGGLSVFAGGWDVAGAQAVASAVDVDPGEVAPLLAGLAQRALIRLDVSPEGGSPARYRLPSGVRTHAGRRLDHSGQRAAAADAHARYVLQLTRAAAKPRRTRFEAAWARTIDADFDDVRVAHHWFADRGHIDESLELVWSLADDVLLRGRHEVGRWAESVATADAASGHRLEGAGLALASNAALVEGRLHRAEQLAEAAVAASEHHQGPGRWIALNTLALLAAAAGDEQTCGRRLFEVLATAQAEGDSFAITTAMYEAVLLYWNAGRPAEGRPLARLLRTIDPAESSPSMLAMASIADGLTDTGENPERARRLLERGMDLASSALSSLLFLHGWRAVHRLVLSSRDRLEAVRQLHAVSEEFRIRGNVNDQMQTVIDLVWHLIELGADRPAAVICGYIDKTPFRSIDRFQRAERRVRDAWDRPRDPYAGTSGGGLDTALDLRAAESDPSPDPRAARQLGREAWDNGAAMSSDALATFIGQTVDRLAVSR